MRTISATLKTAQEAASNTPYIYLLFTSKSGGTTHDYSSDQHGRRILLIDHTEEPYNEYATIILRNEDRSIPNLKGYWTEVGYGYVASGNEYSQTARLWVKHQQEISAQGRRAVLLELEGQWAKAREMPILLGNPPFYQDEDEQLVNITVYAAMSLVLGEISMTLAALAENDGIINSFQPSPEINQQPFESAGGLLYRLISMTKSFLRSKPSLEFEVKYPQESDAVNIDYYSSQAPYFYEYIERDNVLIPNHVYVFANAGEDGMWTNIITGEALDQPEIDLYDDIIQLVMAPSITTQTDADNRAAAILTRAKSEVLGGRLFAPHDCRVELYDKVAIHDSRGI